MLAAALALLLSATGCDLPPLAAARPFSPGETLSYQVGFAGSEQAGRATFSLQASGPDGALVPDPLVRLYTDDAAVIARGAAVLPIVAALQVFDGLHVGVAGHGDHHADRT